MRPIWKGAISFGMVTIPVRLYSATEDRDIHFRLLHRPDAAPVAEKRFCTVEDREVSWNELARGYEVSRGEYVLVEPEELDAIAPETARTIEIDDFVDLHEIDPIYFEKSYFLEPEDVGAKPFQLLRRALEETGRVAVGRVAIRTREKLATLRVYGDTIALETMFWPDEIRATSSLEIPSDEKRQPSAKEMQMARSLVENLSADFRPDAYRDEYRAAVEQLIQRKMHGEGPRARPETPAPKVTDLMEALEASVRAARARRGSKPGEAADGARTAEPEKPEGPAQAAPAKRRRKSAA
ncbi:MAG: Ku protein [Chloroflexi bacterium]|nr:Ku protein [Chloroflexota bacterium]